MEQAVPELGRFFCHKQTFSLEIPLFRHTFLETGVRIDYNKREYGEIRLLLLANL